MDRPLLSNDWVLILRVNCKNQCVMSQNTVQNYFCQNCVKCPPIVKIFGTKIAKTINLSGVHSFSTSHNLCQRTTVLNHSPVESRFRGPWLNADGDWRMLTVNVRYVASWFNAVHGRQGSFPTKKCVNQTVGAPGLANGKNEARKAGNERGEGMSPLHWEGVLGDVPLPEIEINFVSQMGEFWCNLSAFCTVHLKLV